MMRSNPSTSMQKTYDECFLTCSTAVYFEGQNNEAEALRSWKSALDQIYYHNAFRMPSNYRPRSETERALQDSLRQLELQCKERVDLLETLKKSREETHQEGSAPFPSAANAKPPPPPPHAVHTATAPATGDLAASSWLGGGTVPPVDYSDICRPPLPHRPALQPRRSSGPEATRVHSAPQRSGRPSLSPAPANTNRDSRTPSPDKKNRMLRTLRPAGKDGRPSSAKLPSSLRSKPPAAAQAATLAWPAALNASTTSLGRPSYQGSALSKESLLPSPAASSRPSSERPRHSVNLEPAFPSQPNRDTYQTPPPFYFRSTEASGSITYDTPSLEHRTDSGIPVRSSQMEERPISPYKRVSIELTPAKNSQRGGLALPPYRSEYPVATPNSHVIASATTSRPRNDPDLDKSIAAGKKPARSVLRHQSPPNDTQIRKENLDSLLNTTDADISHGPREQPQRPVRRSARRAKDTVRAELPPTPTSDASPSNTSEQDADEWEDKVQDAMKNLPRGIDESAAKQILNEIVIHGDEVHWDDVAGLEVAKSALKETVVYPFLRPDLFMGLREPARGMLLFGPPGTGKTMLARAVATESRSTFFAISASSLTSKFLGESEKLVRALFALAKMLAPSIIFVDEIDSLLSSRSGTGEHEATRRIKTEFLIQWSDLARAAAGREQSDKEKGDASRVLVLAATNLPWAIDEAARRRFVRRQYIPLPEDNVRRSQLETLLSHQKHELDEEGMDQLVRLTDAFSGSDITALAKDAAMGPLRSLGEKLLHMTMDEIRPIQFQDFQASLTTIRPSVSKQGLKEFEDWARDFGERGG